MNTDSDPGKREGVFKFFRSVTMLMAIGVFIFIAIVCVLLVLLLIYGWQLVYMI
jgi:hypothetical protein